MFALKQLKNVSKLTLKSNMVLSTRKSISNSKSLFMSQTNSQDQQKAKVMDLLNTLQTRSTFTNTLGKLEFHKFENDGTLVIKMNVTAPVSNLGGTLHGGAIATAIDFITTVSVGLADRTGRVGVSTDLNVSYFRPAPKDTVVYFHSKVAKHAKAMAFAICDVKNEKGELLASGRHTKYLEIATMKELFPNDK